MSEPVAVVVPRELYYHEVAYVRRLEIVHAELVAALKDARHYASIRFETPLLAIIDAALVKAGAQ